MTENKLNPIFMVMYNYTDDYGNKMAPVIKFINASSTMKASEWADTYDALEKSALPGQIGYNNDLYRTSIDISCINTHMITNVENDITLMKLQIKKNTLADKQQVIDMLQKTIAEKQASIKNDQEKLDALV